MIAHRAGNDLRRLRRAEELRLPLVEADVHLYAGRLEVRHLKTIGPVPVLWDRWELRAPWSRRLLLPELLAAASPATELMLDLKGLDPRLPSRLAACLDAHGAGRRVTVCSRNWRHLRRLGHRDDVRLVHSVGSRRQLDALRRRLGAQPVAGVSIHQELLSERVAAELKRHVALLVSWPVETAADAARLAGWGVDGLISKRFDALAPALEAPSA